MSYTEVFGDWDAPHTRDATRIAVPIDRRCMHCIERFREGDHGCIYPCGNATHRDCAALAGPIFRLRRRMWRWHP